MAAKRKTAAATEVPAQTAEEVVHTIKGTDLQMRCRGVQFEIGKTYELSGKIKACEHGWHGIEGHPLEVFGYYSPGESRYFATVQSGQIARHGSDSKVVSAKVTFEAELKLPDLIARTIKWIMDRCTPEGETATGDRGAASSTGYRGAASSTGNQGAALASGFYGRVMGSTGNALFLVHRNDDGEITHAWAGIVGRDGIKDGVWYLLNADGKPEECG